MKVLFIKGPVDGKWKELGYEDALSLPDELHILHQGQLKQYWKEEVDGEVFYHYPSDDQCFGQLLLQTYVDSKKNPSIKKG